MSFPFRLPRPGSSVVPGRRVLWTGMLLLALGLSASGARALEVPDFAPAPVDPMEEVYSTLDATHPSEPLVDISLTAENQPVAAGQPFTIALRLRHRADAHTAWLNPGGPGRPPQLAWTLPDGFTVDDGQWPAPIRAQSAGFILYSYGGDTRVLFTVAPPPDWTAGSEAELGVRFDGQVCTDQSCTPLRGIGAVLRIAAAETAVASEDADAIALARQRMPRAPDAAWTFSVRRVTEGLAFELVPGAGANPDLSEVYFYDAATDSPVDSQARQTFEPAGDGFRLLVPLVPDAVVPERLRGLLSAPEGWHLDVDTATDFLVDLPVVRPVKAESARAVPLAPPRPRYGVALSLLFAFLGGLILNVMPCVFPIIGLKVMAFVRQAHEDRNSILAHGLMYTLGVLLSFWALAVVVIALGRAWGAQLQSPWTIFLLCHLFLILALNMSGVFEVGMSSGGWGGWLRSRRGLRKSFGTGLLATVVATPCSAPFLATALAYALSLSTPMALGVFTLMALGFASPYLLLSLVPSWLQKLPKPGAWTQVLHRALAFLLYATAAYMLWVLDAMIGEWALLMALLGLVMVAFACWMYGQCQPFDRHRGSHRRALYGAAAIFMAGLWLGLPLSPTGDSDMPNSISDPDGELEWLAWSPEKVSELRDSGRTVYVDFTARWCATCLFNKRVYTDRRLRNAFREHNVALLRADWTQYDERITMTLRNDFGKTAIPVNVLYQPGRHEGLLLPELLTVGAVLNALSLDPRDAPSGLGAARLAAAASRVAERGAEN